MKRLLMVMVAVFAMTAACGGGSSGGTVEGFCMELTNDNTIFKNLGTTASDSEQAIQLFDGLTKKAPSEIKGEMQTLLTFLRQSISDASALSADPSASRSSSHESQLSAQSASVSAASDKVAKFATDKCHIDLGGSGSSSFSTAGSAIEN